MSDYQLKYTGQEIDNLLDKVQNIDSEAVIVTAAFDEYEAMDLASLTPTEIKEAVNQGKQVLFDYGNNYLCTLLYCNDNVAVFIDRNLDLWRIDQNRYLENSDALVTQYMLNDTLEDAIPGTLIVTVTMNTSYSGTASHSSTEIQEWAINGGMVLLRHQPYQYNKKYDYYALRAINEQTYNVYAYFGCLGMDYEMYDGFEHFTLEVDNNKNVSKREIDLSSFCISVSTYYDDERKCYYTEDDVSMIGERIALGEQVILNHNKMKYTLISDAIDKTEYTFHNISEDGHVTVLTWHPDDQEIYSGIVDVTGFDLNAGDANSEILVIYFYWNEEEQKYLLDGETSGYIYNALQDGKHIIGCCESRTEYFFLTWCVPFEAIFSYIDDGGLLTFIKVGDDGSTALEQYSIPFYTDNNNIVISEPVNEWEAATKGYVDETVWVNNCIYVQEVGGELQTDASKFDHIKSRLQNGLFVYAMVEDSHSHMRQCTVIEYDRDRDAILFNGWIWRGDAFVEPDT